MSRELPPRPSLEFLRKQAKRLQSDFQRGDAETIERFRAMGLAAELAEPTLANAQHVLAREYGFNSWRMLKAHVESTVPAADAPAAIANAIKADDAPLVRRLLQQHPEIRKRLNDPIPGEAFGATPLLAILCRKNREMIDVLLEAGADINQKSHWWAGGFGVLDEDHELDAFLIERGATVDVHAAARLGMLDRLEALISANPSLVHALGGDGQTPLHVASSVEVARYLLDHGADIDALDIDHESTPAQWMIKERQPVVRYLVTRGCRTDILMAAALGDIALVRQHLDADPACIHMRVSKEYFPMRNPRAGGSIYGWTLGFDKAAHAIARAFGHEEVVRELLERSPLALMFSQACELGEGAMVQALLTKHPDLTKSLAPSDERMLPDAARDNRIETVRLMLDAGWPVNARGQHHATALHWAAWIGHAEMVRELLRRGAPIEDSVNDFNSSPLNWAIHASVEGWHPDRGDYVGTVEALLQAGAKAPALVEKGDASEAVRAALLRYRRPDEVQA